MRKGTESALSLGEMAVIAQSMTRNGKSETVRSWNPPAFGPAYWYHSRILTDARVYGRQGRWKKQRSFASLNEGADGCSYEDSQGETN